MPQTLRNLAICLALVASATFAQTKPSFEVATIKPAQPMDQAKIMAALQSGGKLPVGATIDSHRAEYLYLDLKTLLTYAYGVKPYQITGPDWMPTTRFDIVAKMPEGSTKEDAPQMLQSLLEERFKLTTHRTSAEHSVLAIVVGKGGPKLKASAEKPVAIDESAPLKPGEMKMDGPDGPVRAKVDIATGSSVVDMGLKGKMSYKINPANQTMHIDFSMITMTGFADMMTQLMTQLAGGTGGEAGCRYGQGSVATTMHRSKFPWLKSLPWRELRVRLFRPVRQAEPEGKATHRRWRRIQAGGVRP